MLQLDSDRQQQQRELLKTILRNHFASDNAGILETIQAEAEYIDLGPGETLIRQGDISNDVYFVLSGRLRALSESESGASKILGEIGRGETIGELAMFTGEPRSASIIALRNCSVVKVTRAVIEATISKQPQIALSMARIVIERFRRRERERPALVVPVNVCILPITPGTDAAKFAESLRAAQAPSDMPVAVITPDDIAHRFGTEAESPVWRRFGAVADFIGRIEAQRSAIYLAADGSDTAWTRFCLQHADEILLLADAERAPGLSDLEQRCFAGKTPVSIARQTLVLLHKVAAKIPTGTAQWLDARHVTRHFHIRPEQPRDMRRLARIISGRAIGLVLAGGGAKGFAHVGVIRALEEAGIEVDYVGGTSIGAVMGMVLALGLDAGQIAAAVHKAFLLHPKGNITGDYNFVPLVSLIKGLRAHGAMTAAVRDAADADIDMEDTWKTFFVIASNFSTGSEAVLSRGSLTRNVIASYAIPGAMPPVFIDGNMMYDGGTFNNFPVDVMAQLGAGKIIGVDLSTDHGRVFAIDRVPGTLALLRDRLRPRAKQRYRLPSVPETLLASSFITSISKQKTVRKFADLLFQPRVAGVGLLDWKRYDHVVAIGYNHAREVLAGLTDEKRKLFR
jgi:NTE family protein